jgi:hypothetical protein
MVLGVGGPRPATLTCLATVAIAYYAALGVEAGFYRLKSLVLPQRQAPVH